MPTKQAEREEVMEQADDDEIQQSWESLDKLQEHGIQVSDIKKLQEAGIGSIQGVMMRTMKELTAIKGLSEAKVLKIREKAVMTQGSAFVTGTSMLEKRARVYKITTGSTALDELLGGGLETNSITEAFGEFRSGKTQLAHTLCVTAQLPPANGGASGKVIYIDTEGTFRPERITAICDRFEVDASAVLDNIAVARVHTSEQQLEILPAAASMMLDDRYSLIVVDSATALFRVDYQGRGTLSERQQNLGKFLSMLTKLAEEFGVAVYITNQVVADPGANAMFGPTSKPIGGHVMAHASTTRLSLRKGRGEQRVCKIYDSPCLPEAECVYQIADCGIIDAKD